MANRPLVQYALETMLASGVREVAVVAKPRHADALRRAVGAAPGGMRVEIVEHECRGSLSALMASEPFLDGAPCLVHQGDGLVRDDLRPSVEELAAENLDALVLVHRASGREPIRLQGRRLLRLVRPEGGNREGDALAGILLCGEGFFPLVRSAAAGGAHTIPDALEQMLDDGGRAHAHLLPGWRQVLTSDQLLEANRIVLDELEPAHPEAIVIRSRVEGRVAIHPTAVVEDTIVRGPAIIGAGARIVHAYVGPYSSIGDGADIEGAEIEHSVILSGAVIKHIGGRLEGSVVGRGSRITRDFALPQAMRVRLGDGGEISLA